MNLKSMIGSLYPHLPIALQNELCTLYGKAESKKRYGKTFKQKLAFMTQAQFFSRQEIQAYQDEQVAMLIGHAYRHVQYYRELFDAHKLTPNDVRAVADLAKVPITTKADIRQNPEKFLSKTAKKQDLILNQTSGSTGQALSFYTNKQALQFQWAVWWRFRERFGVLFENAEQHLNFSGRPVVSGLQKKPPFWRHNRAFNQFIIPMLTLVPDHIEAIAEFVQSKDWAYWVGYPSIIHHFQQELAAKGIRIKGPAYVFGGAEKLYDHQKMAIDSAFQTSMVEQYGFTEGCCNASKCSMGNYHVDFEYGVMRVLNDADEDAKQGRIVGTGFANWDFPFINYQVGDHATMADEDCPCGMKSQHIAQIDGRLEDYILTPEGNKIMRLDYLFKDTSTIKEAQVVQESMDTITINLVKDAQYTAKTEQKILKMSQRWISPSMAIHFNYVSEIPRTSAGKFRAVVNRLDQ